MRGDVSANSRSTEKKVRSNCDFFKRQERKSKSEKQIAREFFDSRAILYLLT
jgi:hypothetical protein